MKLLIKTITEELYMKTLATLTAVSIILALGGAAQGMASGNPPRDLEPRLANLVQVVEINGITVDGAVVMRGHVSFGDEVIGQNAPRRFADSDRFGSRHRADAALQLVERVIQRRQFAAKSEAIVLKLRHFFLRLQAPYAQ